VLAAQVIVNLVFALAGLGIVLAVGAAAFGESAPQSPGGFVLAAALSIAAVFAIGLAVSALARTAGGLPPAALLLTFGRLRGFLRVIGHAILPVGE
jgi:hypothetical protein